MILTSLINLLDVSKRLLQKLMNFMEFNRNQGNQSNSAFSTFSHEMLPYLASNLCMN